MLTKYLTFRNLYLLGFCALFFSLSVSEYVISISQFFLGLIWLVERDYTTKLKRIKNNKYFWIIVSVFFLHVLGLIYTSDYNYAFNDLRIKLPILLIPFFFASNSPLQISELKVLFFFFISGLIISTSFSYYNFIETNDLHGFDPRFASHFISHIRLSLMLSLAIIFLILEIIHQKSNPIIQITLGILASIFLIYMFQLQMLSGILVFGISTFILLELWLARSNYKKLAFLLPLILFLPIGFYLFSTVQGFVFPNNNSELDKVKKSTSKGNKYAFNNENQQLENGNRVWDRVCEIELEEEWEKRSTILYFENGASGQPVRPSLIRYLTSKNLLKDADGLNQLSNDEIKAIENGVTNYRFIHSNGLSKRIYETAWELHNYLINKDNPSGNSVAQRIEFWRAAKHIIKSNWLIGVGTGDIKVELKKAYTEINSVLNPEYRHKPHNQYITTLVCFGFIGFAWFLFVLFSCIPVLKNNYLGLAFLLIFSLSMLTEDTIETQVGVTFFAGFLSLFVIGMRKPKNQLL